MNTENKRATTNLDAHLGGRIKLARAMMGISQAELADNINVTFQQVQKYEKGANRIPATRLYHIAQALNQNVNFFFADQDVEQDEFLPGQKDEHIALVKAYSNISNDKERKVILDIVKSYKKK